MNDDEKFRGDFDRNEVEVDLDRFMAILHENSQLKDEIRELKSEHSVNHWQKWIHAAKTIDAWRLFPRAFITVYMVLLYYSTMWFMSLEQPDLAQAGLISTVVGAGAAWFGLYTRSHGDGE